MSPALIVGWMMPSRSVRIVVPTFEALTVTCVALLLADPVATSGWLLVIATVLFFGGWLRPFPNVALLSFLDVVPPFLWFAAKVAVFLFVYIWFRGTFPRYRFDQLMGLGWKVLLPVSLVNVMAVALGVLLLSGLNLGSILVTVALIAVAVYEWIGVEILRRAWINLDLVWMSALLAAGGWLLVGAVFVT